MAGEVVENWESLLPDVFDLLINKPEKIVDDTSIEKLIAWISDVCGSFSGRRDFLKHFAPFLSNVKFLESATTISFALRVCGIIWCKDSSIFKEYPRWIDLFVKAYDSEVLWGDAAVRHAYFTGLSSLTTMDTGLVWLRENQDCLTTAMNCMSMDSSMFVASAARLLIARFLTLSLSSSQNSNNSSIEHIKWLIDILQQKITSNTQATSDTSKDRIAVLDVMRIVMGIDVTRGQEILSFSKLFAYCIDVIGVSEDCVCKKLVEVIGEIIEKNSNNGNVAWNTLFCSDHHSSASQRLLKLCLDLYQRGMIVDSLYLISSLALLTEESNGVCPSAWLNIICCLITAPLMALEDTTGTPNGSYTNGIDTEHHDTAYLTNTLMSFKGTSSKDLEPMQNKVTTLIKPWLSTKRLQIDVLIQAFSSMTAITSKNTNSPSQTLLQWIEISLKILKSSVYSSDMSGFGISIQGNDKAIKSVLKVLVDLLKHLLNQSYPSHLKETFYDTLEAFIFLARSSQTKPPIITCTLESLSDLLDCGTLFVKALSSNSNDNTTISADELTTNHEDNTKGNAGPKDVHNKANIDPGAKCDAKRPRIVDSKENIEESIGHAVHLRLRDQRWEVKDSALEFVTRLVKSHADYSTSIVGSHILQYVWEALDDENESYIRSSAWQAIAYIVDDDTLWATLKNQQHLTEKDVIFKILNTLENDSEAFPRRSCIDCILLWIHNRKPIVATLLNDMSESECTPECSPNSSEMRSLFTRIIKCAFEDFDWEVKLRGIRIGEAVLNNFSVPGTRINIDSLFTKKVLNVLHRVGFLWHILRACDDCDHPVCEKALSVVGALRNYLYPEQTNIGNSHLENSAAPEAIHSAAPKAIDSAAPKTIDSAAPKAIDSAAPKTIDSAAPETIDSAAPKTIESPITTADQLTEVLPSIEQLSVDVFMDIACRLDMHSLNTCCSAADINIRSNAVCFLEDILACAKDDTENLLDCY